MSGLRLVFNNYLSNLTKMICLRNEIRTLCTFNYFPQKQYSNNPCERSSLLLKSHPNLYISNRFKKTTTKVQKILQEVEKIKEELSDDESDDDDDDEPDLNQRDYKVNSLRIDTVTKVIVGMQRSKIEKAFFQGKIYLNGVQVHKKATEVKIDDVIEFIKGLHPRKDDVLLVTKITLIGFKLVNEGYKLTVTKEETESTDYKLNEETDE